MTSKEQSQDVKGRYHAANALRDLIYQQLEGDISLIRDGTNSLTRSASPIWLRLEFKRGTTFSRPFKAFQREKKNTKKLTHHWTLNITTVWQLSLTPPPLPNLCNAPQLFWIM